MEEYIEINQRCLYFLNVKSLLIIISFNKSGYYGGIY